MQWTSRLAHCDCSYPIYIGPLGRNANLRALDIEWRKRGWSGWICRPCRHRRSLGNGSMTGNGVTINRVNSLGVPSLLVVLCGMCAGLACSEARRWHVAQCSELQVAVAMNSTYGRCAMDFFCAILWEILWSTGSNGILSCGGRPPRACGLRPARRNGRLCNSTRLCSVFYEVVQKDIAFGLWSCPTHPEANGPELPLTYTDFSAHIHQSNLQKSSACPAAPTFPISSLNHPPPTFLLSRSQLRTRPMI